MRSFDFYEFAAILAPGVLSLYGLSLLYPGLLPIISTAAISGGELGVFILVAYVAGHITQALGNLVELCWWKVNCGMPSDWIRTNKGNLLSSLQHKSIKQEIKKQLGLELSDGLETLSKSDWHGLVRQVYVAVASRSRATRAEILNGNYGLSRGIAGSFLLLLIAQVISQTRDVRITVLIAMLLGLSIYRMNRFGKHYAREVFVQFLQPLETAK